MAGPTRVLLLRPDHVGDVLLTAPAVALLRASLPGARLDYVVGPWSADAARHGPTVDRVWPLAYPGFTRRRRANLVAPYAVLVREAALLGLEGRTVIGIHPGAGTPLKSWPNEHWAKVVDGLLSDGLRVVLVGAPDDGPLLAAIETHFAREPVPAACGQSLDVSAALYQRCALVIALD